MLNYELSGHPLAGRLNERSRPAKGGDGNWGRTPEGVTGQRNRTLPGHSRGSIVKERTPVYRNSINRLKAGPGCVAFLGPFRITSRSHKIFSLFHSPVKVTTRGDNQK
jgi:hypothetical protein